MNLLFSVYVLLLFFVLTPGVFLKLPSNGSKYTVTAVHGLLFAGILAITGHYVWKFSSGRFEGVRGNPGPAKKKRPQPKANPYKKKRGTKRGNKPT